MLAKNCSYLRRPQHGCNHFGIQLLAAVLGIVGQNLNEKIGLAAGGLKETAVEPEGLVAYQVEHGVHLAGIGEHLAMVSHPLAAFDLFCVFVVRHKKSWNFAYAHLGVPRPA